MFKKNDIIKYGVNGICKITDVITRDFLGEPMEYYVLMPVGAHDSTFFIPTKNENLTSKMQYILSEAEIYSMLGEISEYSVCWIDNDKERAESFGKTLKSKDRRDLIALVRTIHAKRDELVSMGKKLHAADERIMNDAERMISDEFAAVLGIKPNDVSGFIADYLEKN